MLHVSDVVIVGFGNIGQALLPLLVQYYKVPVTIFEKDVTDDRVLIAQEFSSEIIRCEVTEENYCNQLSPRLRDCTLLLNLAVSVSSLDLISLAQERGAFYLDTCIEPWEYSHSDVGISTGNYFLREEMKSAQKNANGRRTAIVAHGANPGFISILMKKALLEMARLNEIESKPVSQDEWANLAKDLDVRVIQISERDTQVSYLPRSVGEFVCTWSVDGLITEALQPAELGWGSHEMTLPDGSVLHNYGSRAGIALAQSGREVRVKSWSPNSLDFTGYLITHNESLSMADYLSVLDDDGVVYRPTTYYAYHPCDDAVESMELLADGTERSVLSKRVVKSEVVSGIDELGVFLISGKYPALWYGSNLSIGRTRNIVPHNNATSLQVVSSILAAVQWLELNPCEGILESEQLDWEFVFERAAHYWSPLICTSVQWTPTGNPCAFQFDDFLVRDSGCLFVEPIMEEEVV